ncbi:MOSC domain-containing protein [Lampropedia puyangensis]|uniref:MOSC domain-containing protein n=1 Tax=Lampropedia puyangensis TaxID=1330072 RepID=A0A4S8EZC9_9BURK|nr:MOSC N-terminal beta barrel domain-containing protein [Lampropedia puyangensis]THU00303.1 MOSC domain-containing protein [Lampropedia puyangensis]
MKVTALNLYPVKSMGAIVVDHAQVGMQGFVGDREWLVADMSGRFITAREVESLLLWQPELTDTGLRLRAPNGRACVVHRADYQELANVIVWKDQFQAYSGPAETDAWLSDQMGMPCRLFYVGAAPHRTLAANGGGTLSFADGAPYLLTSEVSLNALNQALQSPVSMRRFRANIVVDGLEPYAEDKWKDVQIGGVLLTGFKPCGRCKIVNLDPGTAQLSPEKEPLKTLAKTHQLAQGACFGMNFYARSVGRIQVGDHVQLQT